MFLKHMLLPMMLAYYALADNNGQRERKGKCPAVGEVGICVIFYPICKSDNDCGRNEKCCDNACGGRSCKQRELEKDEKNLFVCPAPDSCSSDDNCKGKKMCCQNNCGLKTCQRPERFRGGQKKCPAQIVSYPLYDQCKTDKQCHGRRQKCCPNECGVKSCKKSKKIECSNVKCADPNCGPGEVAYIPKNSCCQTCKRDCSTVRCLEPVCKFGEVKYVPEGGCCYQCKLDCSRILCVRPICQEGYIAIVPDGECCPKCVEDCKGKQCHPIHCKPDEFKYKPEGKCCEICKPNTCENGKDQLKDKICSGFGGFECPLGYICDTSNVPPEIADGTGICCEGTCIDKDTGKGYAAGEMFKKDCNTCTCSVHGTIGCTKKLCQPCIHGDGIVYPSGSSYKDQCNICSCSDGLAFCTKVGCFGCQSGYPSPADQTCNATHPTCSKGYDCELRGEFGFCCKQPICSNALDFTYCNNDRLTCPNNYYCQLDGGKEGLGSCCLDCRTVKCAEPICKPGYVAYQPKGECCKICKKDCSATTCLTPTCKDGEELFTPEGECCALCKGPNDCYDKENDVIFTNGQEFWSRCNGCLCKDGLITCTEVDCDDGYCESGIKPIPTEICRECTLDGYSCDESDQCCREPTCLDALRGTYCTTNDGCPLDYSCNLPEGEERGFCCPDKPQKPCYRYGVKYESGDSFPEQCNNCTCNDGSIGCTEKACLGCYFEQKQYNEGDAVDINNECGECVCTENSGKFEVKCPKCCVLNDQVIHTGDSIKGVDVCEFCSCFEDESFAQMACAAFACPACVGIPVEGECCPDCSRSEVIIEGNDAYGVFLNKCWTSGYPIYFNAQVLGYSYSDLLCGYHFRNIRNENIY